MSKHTPGPWVAQRDTGAIMADDWCIGAQGQIDMVAVCSERDARLIAAAPDLLAVLQELEESVDYWSEYDVPLGIVDRIRAAIAKAESKT